MDVTLGMKLKSRKIHPCGGDIWEVTRVGADIKMKCINCGRIVMLDREKFLKIIKKVL